MLINPKVSCKLLIRCRYHTDHYNNSAWLYIQIIFIYVKFFMATNKALLMSLQYYKEVRFLTCMTLSTLEQPVPCWLYSFISSHAWWTTELHIQVHVPSAIHKQYTCRFPNRCIHVQLVGFEIYACTPLYQVFFLGPPHNYNVWEAKLCSILFQYYSLLQ